MSLREEMAEKLGAIEAEVVKSGCEAYASAKEIRRELSLAYADECIRQMEWAQDQGWKDYDINKRPLYKAPPLTLAPEEWKP